QELPGLVLSMENAAFWVGAFVSMISCGAVLAQSAPPAADSNNNGLEEIVITAERRSENLQSVPIAVNVLKGGDLHGKAVASIADLQYSTPSVSIGDAGLTNAVNIRGVGLASGSPAVANGVATYVDGLFQPQILSTTSSTTSPTLKCCAVPRVRWSDPIRLAGRSLSTAR